MAGAAYWPFWAGGLALASVAILHLRWTRRYLTVSGVLSRLLRWSEDQREREAELRLSSGGLDDALLAATRARFGDLEEAEVQVIEDRSACGSSDAVRMPVSAGALFLVCLVAGGALGGGGPLEADPTAVALGHEFERLVGSGGVALAGLLGGGFLVGFGARMAGGCTSGHGLCGMARLQPGSAVATAAFFAGGIAVSFLLEAMA